jgi:hypothetical protein
MTDLQILKGCELHVHIGGCLAADDLLAMGEAHYEAVDWTLFVDSYEAAFGVRLDPHHLLGRADGEGGQGDSLIGQGFANGRLHG